MDLGITPVAQVGTVETGDKTVRLVQAKRGKDIRPNPFGGCSRQRHHRHFGKLIPQTGQLTVFRTEIVPPLAHTVSLVDSEHPHLPPLQIIETTGEQEPLRGHVEQTVLPVVQAAQTQARFILREAGIEECRGDPGHPQGIDLIFHQSDQR